MQEGIVVKKNKDTVIIATDAAGEVCVSCTLKHGCHAIAGEPSKRSIRAANPAGADKGDKVRFEMAEGTRILIFALIFILPVLVMFGAYYVSCTFFDKESVSAIISILSLPVTVMFLKIFEKQVNRRKPSVTVVEIISKGAS
ncbi:MAG: SoxR reducing system RseC family protein [Fibrobacterota bacterium]